MPKDKKINKNRHTKGRKKYVLYIVYICLCICIWIYLNYISVFESHYYFNLWRILLLDLLSSPHSMLILRVSVLKPNNQCRTLNVSWKTTESGLLIVLNNSLNFFPNSLIYKLLNIFGLVVQTQECLPMRLSDSNQVKFLFIEILLTLHHLLISIALQLFSMLSNISKLRILSYLDTMVVVVLRQLLARMIMDL